MVYFPTFTIKWMIWGYHDFWKHPCPKNGIFPLQSLWHWRPGILLTAINPSRSERVDGSLGVDQPRCRMYGIFTYMYHKFKLNLVGGFNPLEKYSSNWIIPPGRVESQKYLESPPKNVGEKYLVLFGCSLGWLWNRISPSLKQLQEKTCQHPPLKHPWHDRKVQDIFLNVQYLLLLPITESPLICVF